jgi:ABC-2 family transporter protein
VHAIVTLALKDLRLLRRNRAGLFFTFVWPLLVAIGFGAMLGGSTDGGSKMRVAVVDEDGSPGSAAFVARLQAARELATEPTSRDEAEDSVRKGRRTAFVIVPKGFGEASARVFFGTPPTVELGVDPSRRAESGMLEGVLMKYGVEGMQEVFSDPAAAHRAVENARRSLPPDKTHDPEVASTAAFLAELDKYLQRPRHPASSAPGNQDVPDADVDDRRRDDSALPDAAVARPAERDQPRHMGDSRVRRRDLAGLQLRRDAPAVCGPAGSRVCRVRPRYAFRADDLEPLGRWAVGGGRWAVGGRRGGR